jgi:DNA-binding NtrC family response regulator
MAKVLLVDDNGSVLLTLAIALRRHGHTVTIASDGDTALSELHAATFDALVSDVRMPGLNGPELAAEARRLHPELRIVLTSAYPSVESDAGIAAFLRKPIDIEQLHALLSPTENKATQVSLPAPAPPKTKASPRVERRRAPRRTMSFRTAAI